MAKKTVQEIRESVLAYGFSANNYTNSINAWIDEGQRYMIREAGLRNKEKSFAFQTVVNTQDYELPSDFSSMVSIRNTTLNPEDNLNQIESIKEFDELEETTGTPIQYIIEKEKIRLYPIPNVVIGIALRYNILPSAIASESSASPSIYEDYIHLIEEYCLYKAYAREGDIEMSNFHKGIFDREMVRFTGDMNTDTQDATQYVEGAWSMGYP